MTDRIVVDTNVLIVANGRDDTPADLECEDACINLLLEASKGRKTVLLDTSELIMDEYGRRCSYTGTPVGNMFYKYLNDFEHSTSKIIHILIQQTPDEEGGFVNLPPNDFDPDDRKFLAVAKAGDGRVVNATDSDWSEHADFIESLGVRVIELCPQCLK
ncbi:MAG: hypothetical protein OXG62_12985 [Nitrospinae bacterium]|nr:hypothetical protein [Nitrospinota bacterium]